LQPRRDVNRCSPVATPIPMRSFGPCNRMTAIGFEARGCGCGRCFPRLRETAPAVGVQSDFFNATHASITLCPITSQLVDTPLFRIPVERGNGTGLKAHSQIMIDKIMSVPRERIGKKTGKVPDAVLRLVDEALRLWLDVRR